MGETRFAGANNVFYTCAPDDVHDPAVVALCEAAVDVDQALRDGMLSKLRASSDAQRAEYGEDALQAKVAKNPVACVMWYEHTKRNVTRNLLRLQYFKDRRDDAPYRLRPVGIFGRLYLLHSVTEENGRGALHFHGCSHGGCTPAMVADVAHNPPLNTLAAKTLGTHARGHLPPEYHAVAAFTEVLKVRKRRDAAFDIPEDAEGRLRYALLTAAYRNLHTTTPLHHPTCTKGHLGKTGCRLRCPWGHNVPEPRVLELTETAYETPGMVVSDTDVIRCPACWTQHRSAVAEDKVRKITYGAARTISRKPGMEEKRTYAPAKDDRALTFELARPLLRAKPRSECDFVMGTVGMGVDCLDDASVRKWFKGFMASEEFMSILGTPGLEALRDKLVAMKEDPPSVEDLASACDAKDAPCGAKETDGDDFFRVPDGRGPPRKKAKSSTRSGTTVDDGATRP
jgi:hypothetical protein